MYNLCLSREQQDYVVSLYDKGVNNNSEIARQLISKFNLDKDQYHLSRTVKRVIDRFELDQHRGNAINNYANEQSTGIPNIKHLWHKTEMEDGTKVSVFIKNPQEEENMKAWKNEILSGVKEITNEWDVKKRSVSVEKNKRKLMLKVTISDAHVGLEPNPDGKGLFQYEYNADLFMKGLDRVLDSVRSAYATYGSFDRVVIQDLGDALDGRDGFTTRGGHKLDQNMDNKEAFKTYIRGKIMLITSILELGITNDIVVRDVCNDNHSGSFGSIANFTVSEIVNRVYGEGVVTFQPIEQFIGHYTYGKHCFITTHGKDCKHMKYGLPLVLNDKAIKFIHDYIDHYNIKSDYIHVEKGDLHQLGYQKIKKFDYRNYMSFAPGSAWVSHNFGDTYAGYSIDIVPKDSPEIIHSDFFIDYKRK